jgi:ubiquinone/menaquinone biosynthesis C-methylase UbiE
MTSDVRTHVPLAPAAVFSDDEIASYWTAQARQFGTDHAASWTDGPMIDLETRTIGEHLHAGALVLDVGCANGFSTLRYAREHDVCIKGVDYVPEMIIHASARLVAEGEELAGRVSFGVGDARALGERTGAYDAVITTRVLINLGDWAGQRRALRELARVTRPGGLMLFSEATVQGFSEMNAARTEWGLAEIPCKPFNVYLDEALVVDELRRYASDIDVVDYSSSYFFGTRVLKPLLSAALGVEVPTESRFNRFFSEMPAFGRMGTQRLFVARRRAD